MELTPLQKELVQSLTADNPEMYIVWDENNGMPKHLVNINTLKQGLPEAAARAFLIDIEELFKFKSGKDGYLLNSIQKDSSGNIHVRLLQSYFLGNDQIQVEEKQIVVHLDDENHILGFDANLFSGISSIIINGPKYSLDDVVPIAENFLEGNKIVELEKSPLAIKVINNHPHLVWKITILNDRNEDDVRAYYIDSMKKTILGYRSLVFFSGTTINANGYGFFSNTKEVNITRVQNNDIHFFDQEMRVDHRLTNSVSDGLIIRSYKREYDNYQDLTLGANNNINEDVKIEVDCQIIARKIFDYFLNRHGRLGWGYLQNTSISRDFNFVTWRVWTSFGPGKQNSNSEFRWQFSDESIGVISVGSGDYPTNAPAPFCSEDILAHEWTHAILAGEVKFSDDDEPRALCEAICDGFACFITKKWRLGEAQGAVKDVMDPSQSGVPPGNDPQATLYSQLIVESTSTNMFERAYWNSGIINKMTYLITEGGTHNGITIINGVGIDFTSIWYHDALNHLTSNSSFHDFVCALHMTLDDYVRKEEKKFGKIQKPSEIIDSLDLLIKNLQHLDKCKSILLKSAVAVGIMDTSCICPIFMSPHYKEIQKIIKKIRSLSFELDR